jgi:hypothetical protein
MVLAKNLSFLSDERLGWFLTGDGLPKSTGYP